MKIKADELSSLDANQGQGMSLFEIATESDEQKISTLLQQAGAKTSAQDILDDLREKCSRRAEETFEDRDYQDSTSFDVWEEEEFPDGIFYRFDGKGEAFWKQGMKGDQYLVPDDPDEVSSWYVSGTLELWDGDGEEIGEVELYRFD